jgi:formamidopyrimidine-DNA glycosylase
MPELPDIVVYIEALEQRILGETLKRVNIASPFLLRTAVPPISSVEGHRVVGCAGWAKRTCIGVEEDLWLVLHLMIAGRLHWKDNLHTRGWCARNLCGFAAAQCGKALPYRQVS